MDDKTSGGDNKEKVLMESPVCPVPLTPEETITLGHGSGGRLTHNLVQNLFIPPWENPALSAGDDGAVLDQGGGRQLVLSTDSHVVRPLFFPGGDIGRLAVCGGVNDVAMMGAKPLYLTAGFVLEEGLRVENLRRIIQSMASAAEEAGVQVVAGDTKVVEKGLADGMYITTTAVGWRPSARNICGASARPEDVVLISGSLGDHGIAVIGARGDLGLQLDLESDVAPLKGLVEGLLNAADNVHVLRDPTRGGLATSLNEIARQSGIGIILEESKLPIKPEVTAACDLLGFDPLYVANEGKLLAIVAPQDAEKALEALHQHPLGRDAAIIGRVDTEPSGRVLMRTRYGTDRLVDLLSGEMLPRIC